MSTCIFKLAQGVSTFDRRADIDLNNTDNSNMLSR
jgi:hypothetical protein